MDDEMRQFMATINNKLDDILSEIAPRFARDRLSLAQTKWFRRDREDIENTRGHIVYVLEDSLTLGKRITKLEDEIRRARR